MWEIKERENANCGEYNYERKVLWDDFFYDSPIKSSEKNIAVIREMTDVFTEL